MMCICKLLKLWQFQMLCIGIICLFWYYKYVTDGDYNNMTKPPVLIELPKDKHTTNIQFTDTNIHYISLNKEAQTQRLQTFKKELKQNIVLNESFIINNWHKLHFNKNSNCTVPTYSKLSDLYDEHYINLHKLSKNICKWEHKINRKINTKVFEINRFEYIRKSVKIQEFMMNELFLKYGIISVLRCGELMGAFRDGGHFPWESSSDHFAILPLQLSVKCFNALNEKLVYDLNDSGNIIIATTNDNKMNVFDPTSMYYNYYNEPKWKYYRSSGPWENYLRSYEYWTEYEKFWTDGTLLDFKVIKNQKFNQVFYDIFEVKPIDFFNDENMCLCNYSNTIAFAFEEEQIDQYLSITYDPNYMDPHPNYKGSIEKVKGFEISSFVYWENDDKIARECQLNNSKCFN
eukprot:448469_1